MYSMHHLASDSGHHVSEVESVPAPFWCTGGCGGGLSDSANGLSYNFNYGTCVAQDECMCNNKHNSTKPAFAGRSCEQVLCDPPCMNGECTE